MISLVLSIGGLSIITVAAFVTDSFAADRSGLDTMAENKSIGEDHTRPAIRQVQLANRADNGQVLNLNLPATSDFYVVDQQANWRSLDTLSAQEVARSNPYIAAQIPFQSALQHRLEPDTAASTNRFRIVSTVPPYANASPESANNTSGTHDALSAINHLFAHASFTSLLQNNTTAGWLDVVQNRAEFSPELRDLLVDLSAMFIPGHKTSRPKLANMHLMRWSGALNALGSEIVFACFHQGAEMSLDHFLTTKITGPGTSKSCTSGELIVNIFGSYLVSIKYWFKQGASERDAVLEQLETDILTLDRILSQMSVLNR